MVTVGFHSPLPPAPTGVADYAAALLPALKQHGDVRAGESAATVHLYHLGNNQLHSGIYRRALRQPGLVVLHDAVLQHFLLGALSEEQYLAEFTYNYGEWSYDLGRSLWRSRAHSATAERFFQYPMLRRIAESARGIIVHNPGAASLVLAHAPQARIFEIPHLLPPAPRVLAADTNRLRNSLGLGAREFLVGIFGHLRESKRVFAVLRAFEQARRIHPRLRLLVSGACTSASLQAALEPLLRGSGIFRLPFLEESDFWNYAHAVDACINLRYPAAGETSGIAMRLMGIGKPVLVTQAQETSRLPPAACIPIAAGLAEESALTDMLLWLARFPEDAREIGSRAQQHVRAEHNLPRVASLYWQALSVCANRSE